MGSLPLPSASAWATSSVFSSPWRVFVFLESHRTGLQLDFFLVSCCSELHFRPYLKSVFFGFSSWAFATVTWAPGKRRSWLTGWPLSFFTKLDWAFPKGFCVPGGPVGGISSREIPKELCIAYCSALPRETNSGKPAHPGSSVSMRIPRQFCCASSICWSHLTFP